jgi:hypothetical protein
MERLQGAYRRWATAWLFLIGLVIAFGANMSTVNIASSLWSDSLSRQAVVAAAQNIQPNSGAAQNPVQVVSDAVQKATSYQLPVGWNAAVLPNLAGWGWLPWGAGCVLTALLVMLGAPFWYDALTRLLSLRAGEGIRPGPATDDPASATAARTTLGSAGFATTAYNTPGTAAQGPLHEQLTMMIKPPAFTPASVRAAERSIVVDGSRRRVTIADLPAGRYTVSLPRAAGAGRRPETADLTDGSLLTITIAGRRWPGKDTRALTASVSSPPSPSPP